MIWDTLPITYQFALPRKFWRWFSVSKGGVCIVIYYYYRYARIARYSSDQAVHECFPSVGSTICTSFHLGNIHFHSGIPGAWNQEWWKLDLGTPVIYRLLNPFGILILTNDLCWGSFALWSVELAAKRIYIGTMQSYKWIHYLHLVWGIDLFLCSGCSASL